MIKLKGKYTLASIYAKVVDEGTIEQVQKLIDNEVSKDSKVVLMPDCHVGKGCTIGTTMTIKDKVCPNLVGVDIGCGVTAMKTNLHINDADFKQIDKDIRRVVPLGTNVHKENHMDVNWFDSLRCINHIVNKDRILQSCGTLGGGNHFIEMNKDTDGYLWVVVHSGSRNFGQQIATHYQKLAEQNMTDRVSNDYTSKIQELKDSGRHSEIKDFIEKNKPKKMTKSDLELAYLTDSDMDNYLNDIFVAQSYASYNRDLILFNITNALKIKPTAIIESVHNYIDKSDMVLRKGSISAKKDEYVLIPLNMEDGIIIGKGLGNDDWNNSAPHGAGRVMSRKVAKENINVDDVIKSMSNAGVYTTSISNSTIDEAKDAYKPKDAILDHLSDNVKIQKILKPVYNLKG